MILVIIVIDCNIELIEQIIFTIVFDIMLTIKNSSTLKTLLTNIIECIQTNLSQHYETIIKNIDNKVIYHLARLKNFKKFSRYYSRQRNLNLNNSNSKFIDIRNNNFLKFSSN